MMTRMDPKGENTGCVEVSQEDQQPRNGKGENAGCVEVNQEG